MRIFQLVRDIDETGVSGTGVVADGVEFPDGVCAMRWRPGDIVSQSTAVYNSVEDVVAIHGHGGMTKVRWSDGND